MSDGPASRVVVITGASSGIGRACAREFSRCGDFVILVARREHELTETLAQCKGHGRIFVCDLAHRDQIASLAQSIERNEGRCDVLVNNAGVGSRRAFDGPESLATVDELMAVNFQGAVDCTGYLLPLLRRSHRAAIVSVASVAGFVGFPGAPTYCASKFALRGFFESLHYQLRTDGIHVSTVCPGPVPTEGWPHERLARSPLRRLLVARPEQVARRVEQSSRGGRAVRMLPRLYGVLVWITSVIPPLRGGALRLLAGRPRDTIPADRARERSE